LTAQQVAQGVRDLGGEVFSVRQGLCAGTPVGVVGEQEAADDGVGVVVGEQVGDGRQAEAGVAVDGEGDEACGAAGDGECAAGALRRVVA
jgi:hypothetical protein